MIINIPLNTGLMTHPEPEDIGSGGNSILSDYDIDVPGKLVKREALGDLITNASIISDKGVSFVHRITTTDPYDTETELFILQKDDKTIVYKTDTAFANQSAIIALPSPYPSLINFLQEGQRLRITAGTEGLPWIYQYIDRDYFWGFYNPSAGYNMQKAYVRLSDTQFTRTAIINDNIPNTNYGTSTGTGLDLSGTDEYYYKIAPVFDGNQVGLLSDIKADTLLLTGSNVVPKISFELDTTSYNKRLTGVRFYRSKNNPNSNFYNILDVSTLKNDPSLIKANDGDIGKDVYSPSATGVTSSHKFYGSHTSKEDVSSFSDNIVTLTNNIASNVFREYSYFIIPTGIKVLSNITSSESGATTGGSLGTGMTQAQGTDGNYVTTEITKNSTYTYYAWSIALDNSLTYDFYCVYKTEGSFTNLRFKVGSGTDFSIANIANGQLFEGIEDSPDWKLYHKSFSPTTPSGNTIFGFDSDETVGSKKLHISRIILIERDGVNSRITASLTYGGSDTFVSPSLNLDNSDTKKGNIANLYQTPGTPPSNKTVARIEKNSTKAIKFTKPVGWIDSTVELHTSENYLWSDLGSNKIQLDVFDRGLFDGATSLIEGVENIDVHYKYGVHLDGRLYVGNVKLDSDGEQELHTDWILFSELNSPDVIPVSNYIKITDMQGGEITGLAKMLGDLVVFMNKGIFRISTPSADPTSWSLVESEQNIGCISSESIVEVEGNIFFAGDDQIYQLDQNFQAVPISLEIQDTWQGTSNKHLTKGTYDPKKRRIIYQFGGGSNTPYMYYVDMKAWSSYTLKGITADGCLVDKDMNVYVIDKESSSTKFYKLYNVTTSSETETTPYKKTGFISLTDIGKNTIVRRINIRGKFKGVVRIYKNNSTEKWNSAILNLSTTSGKSEQSIKVGMRADSIALELYSNHTLPATNIDISRIEIEVDGG